MDLWLEIVIGAISGGLAGTIVTLYFERRQRRQATAVTLVQEYQARYDLLREVNDLFLRHAKHPNSWDDEARFKALKMGNWYEVAALLYNTGLADRQLVQQMGLDRSILNFYQRACTVPMLEYYVKRWKEMDHLSQKMEAKKDG
jgi:hypothetical protein